MEAQFCGRPVLWKTTFESVESHLSNLLDPIVWKTNGEWKRRGFQAQKFVLQIGSFASLSWCNAELFVDSIIRPHHVMEMLYHLTYSKIIQVQYIYIYVQYTDHPVSNGLP